MRATLGRFPDLGLAAARAKARRILADPESGSGLTVGELVAQYLDWLPGAKYRREREYRRLLTREILPALGAVRIAELRRRDLIALLEEKAKTAPVVANHVHVRLSALFAWARLRDLIQANPMGEIPKPTPYRARDRVLTDDEIRALWGSGLSLVVGACLRMILLTGQRPSEVRLMRWSEVSGSWWTIPRERAKSDRAHRVHLSAAALEALEGVRGVCRGHHPFANPRTGVPVQLTTLSMMARRKGLGFRPHDLRRTCASGMASLGVPRAIVARVLNHSDRSITAVYDRYSYDRELVSAWEAWGEHVRGLVT